MALKAGIHAWGIVHRLIAPLKEYTESAALDPDSGN